MKFVEETFRQLLQMVLCLWVKLIFVYIDKVLKEIEFVLNFPSLLLTGENLYRRNRKG